MLVYGKNVSREILNSNININKIYLIDNFKNEELLKLINKKKIKIEYKSMSEMDRLALNNQGIILDIEDYKYSTFNDIENDKNANFIVILDHIEDMGNFGAIIRTCECANVDYIIIPNKRSIEVNSTVMKTSSGALANVKIVSVANLYNTILWAVLLTLVFVGGWKKLY